MALRPHQPHAQAAIARLSRGTGRRSKYGASPTIVDGIRFASQKEARRYGQLKLLERAAEISGLTVQPSYCLEALQTGGEHARRSCVVGIYRADFAYYDKQGEEVVEDVKGFKTPLYRWKKRHVEAQYGIQIREL